MPAGAPGAYRLVDRSQGAEAQAVFWLTDEVKR